MLDKPKLIFWKDRRSDQNEQRQFNDTLFVKTQMFYTMKQTPIQWLDPVHKIGLTQAFAQVFIYSSICMALSWGQQFQWAPIIAKYTKME